MLWRVDRGGLKTLRHMMWSAWILAILVIQASGVVGGSRFHERVRSGLLTLYGLDDGQRSENQRPLFARDYTGLGLLGNLTIPPSASTEWYADRTGFRIPYSFGGVRAVSEKTTSELLTHLTDEFTIELIIQSPTNPGGNKRIAGFGNWPPGTPFSICDAPLDGSSPRGGGGWQLFSAPGNSVRFHVITSLSGNPSCVELGIVIPTGIPWHVSVRAQRGGALEMYTRHAIDVTSDAVFNSAFWELQPLTFAPSQPDGGWVGTVNLFAMYNRYLNDTELDLNDSAGLPNALPVTATSALAVTEDVSLVVY